MSLTYIRDRYKKLSEDILDGEININNSENRQYLYNELRALGERNIEDRIKTINKNRGNKYDKSNLVKDIFREVNGEIKPQMKIKTESANSKTEILEENTINISTDKPYKDTVIIKIEIENYNGSKEEDDVFKFIKTQGKNIFLEDKSFKFDDNTLSLELKYNIKFKKNTTPGEYKESIQIAFKDVEVKIYEFFINCSAENNKEYNFTFKSVDELYNVFKEEVTSYNDGIIYEAVSVVNIFRDRDFVDYLNYIKEYTARDLYKSLNLVTYKLEDLNLFFTTLGYERCYIKDVTVKPGGGPIKSVKKIEENIDLRLFKLYYIEDIENNLKIKVFSNKNNDIEVKKANELIPNKLYKLLKFILRTKLDVFDSSIFIKDNNLIRHIFTYYVKKEYLNKSFTVLVSSEKSCSELNLYSLKIHM